MERPPDSLKTFADRMAKVAVSDDATQMVRLLQLSGLTGAGLENQAAQFRARDIRSAIYVTEPDVPPRHSKHIGVWERKVEEEGKTVWVRRLEMMDQWHFWAAHLGRIEAKGSKPRILFMGESVARGYLYDPDFTPAIALQMILDRQCGKGELEVIDLARTNLEYKLRELASAALQLEPDIAICFAGNNWGVPMPSLSGIADMDKALVSEGMTGVKRISDAYIGSVARQVLSDIASEYKEAGVPLIWIIPESNLGDWCDPATNAPYLPGDRNKQWLKLVDEARSALRNGDPETAEKLARKMIELDQGVCGTGYHIVADCRRLANDPAGEKKNRELARDSQSWDSSMTYIPKSYCLTQQIMREVMAEYGQQIVDLPALLTEYLNGEVPGRQVFLDYCHLTTAGIQVAMGAAASCVLRSLNGVDIPWYALADGEIAPSPQIEAEANFLAAIHDAHRWQSYDVTRHYCERAIESSPHVAEMMLSYLDLQTQRSAPLRMSEAEEKIFHLGSPLVHRYLFRNNNKRLDKTLLGAMVDALEAAGFSCRERLEQLRREEHSVRNSETDLLHFYYYSAAEQPQELEALNWPNYRLATDTRYFRAFSPESRFLFVAEAGYAVKLSLTCRLPKPAPREEKITIALNGEPQVEITINNEWTTWDIILPGEVVHDGLNEVAVRWPIPDFRSTEALSRVTKRLCAQKFPDFYAFFGEIHTFTASNGEPVAPPALAEVQAESSLVEIA
jgi:hypothetical protein